MTDHLILLAPAGNRVYAGSADVLSAAELALLLGRGGCQVPAIGPVQLAGVGYLRLGLAELDPRQREAVAALSTLFAVFRRDGDHLTPVQVHRPDLFGDDLVTIPKYPGKTNEQFTRLLVNVALASVAVEGSDRLSILDPLCGRGTTLSTGLTLGHDVAGVDVDLKAIEAYAAFLRTYLRRHRLKHTVQMSPVRREGRSLGRRLDVEVTPAGTQRRLRLTAFSGDTRQSAALYGKRRFDAVVADAPYGVVHGSEVEPSGRAATGARGTEQPRARRDRSPAGLIGEALSVWSSQLRTGGALGLSWNTFGLSREALTALAVAAGLTPLDEGPYLSFGHRVDSSISRDLFVARLD